MGIGKNRLLKPIPKSILVKLYVDQGLNGSSIAKQLNCGKQTVYNYLEKYGILKRKQADYTIKKRSQVVDVKCLIRKFMIENKSVEQIAVELGISKTFCKKIIGFHRLNNIKKANEKNKSRFVKHHGYIWKYEPKHPRALRNKGKRFGFVREHILVVEKKMGRLLADHEVVHHIDGIKHNNHPDNLYVSDGAGHRNCHASLERIAFKLVQAGVIKFKAGEYYV